MLRVPPAAEGIFGSRQHWTLSCSKLALVNLVVGTEGAIRVTVDNAQAGQAGYVGVEGAAGRHIR